MDPARIDAIAAELMALLGTGRSAPRYPGLGLAEAYAVGARIRERREARGERVVGRKIGFTNTTIWEIYGVSGPMWSYVYDATLHELAATPVLGLAGFAEPRIEPEIVLHLAAAPEPGMDEAALLGCVDWIAHGFEIVQSVYPGWKLTGAEAAAAFGLHGALLLGPRHDVRADRTGWLGRLSGFGIRLARNGAAVAEGHASHVLGGPLGALRFAVEEIARYPSDPPIAAGEVVTTGTLTDAQPARPGDRWSTRLDGLPVAGLALAFG